MQKSPITAMKVELIKTLIEREHCTTEMVYRITGIPTGTVSSVCFYEQIQRFSGRMTVNKARWIARTRKVVVLRTKYATQISAISQRKKLE